MAQQSWRRVLGETSLERKCRLLFGFWLTLLISGAFWGVEKVSSDLILKNTRTTARDVVDVALMKPHFNYWETRKEQQGFAELLMKELAKTDGRHNHEIIVLDEDSKPKQIHPMQVLLALLPRRRSVRCQMCNVLRSSALENPNFELDN